MVQNGCRHSSFHISFLYSGKDKKQKSQRAKGKRFSETLPSNVCLYLFWPHMSARGAGKCSFFKTRHNALPVIYRRQRGS